MFGLGPIELLIIVMVVLGDGGFLVWVLSRKS